MKTRALVMTSIFVLTSLAATTANADCAALTLYRGVASIEIVAAKPMKTKKDYWLADIKVLTSRDTFITEKKGKQVIQFLPKPIFKGTYRRIAIKCARGVCKDLAKVDFSKHVVRAEAFLTVDCPDTLPIEPYAEIIQAEYLDPTGWKYINLMQVKKR